MNKIFHEQNLSRGLNYQKVQARLNLYIILSLANSFGILFSNAKSRKNELILRLMSLIHHEVQAAPIAYAARILMKVEWDRCIQVQQAVMTNEIS